ETLPWFIVLMTLNGLAQGTGWGGTVGNMAAWFHRGERGTVMGFWATCFQAGGVAANALSAFVLAHYGFREAFFAGSAALLAIWSWPPLLLKRRFDLALDDAGSLSTLFAVFGVVGVLVTGWLSDRVFGGLRARVSFLMVVGLIASTALLATLGGQSVALFAVC